LPRAGVDHTFVIGDQTLPPGEYTFRATTNPDQSLMIATHQNSTNVARFLVRQTVVVFRKYGNTECLTKILEVGSKDGVAVVEPSKQKAHFINAGQQALKHSEEQKVGCFYREPGV
jgi:hypothetical protein